MRAKQHTKHERVKIAINPVDDPHKPVFKPVYGDSQFSRPINRVMERDPRKPVYGHSDKPVYESEMKMESWLVNQECGESWPRRVLGSINRFNAALRACVV